MYVIIGLGNYGSKYEHTRHNAGVDSLNILAQRNGIDVRKNKFKSLIGEGIIGGKKCVLAFPQTYMNLSGEAARELVNFYKPEKGELIVIYDDLDLPKGGLRIREKGSAGTHNGMRSIVQHLGSDDFVRVRVGIGKQPEFMDIIDWVIGKVPKEDWQIMFDTYTNAAKSVEELVANGLSSAMCKYNFTPKPPKPPKADDKKEETPKETEKETVKTETQV